MDNGPVIRARRGWLIIWGFIPGDEALPVFSFVDRSEWMMFDTLNKCLVRWLFCSCVGLFTTLFEFNLCPRLVQWAFEI